MARLLLFHHKQTIASQAGFAVGTLFLCAFTLFMCASHARKWRRWRAEYSYRNREPVIQLNNESMMIQGFQFGNDDGIVNSGGLGEVSVWKKNIIMGGKCQLPDFSGLIMYDSAGNVTTPAKAPKLALTWK